MDFLIFILITSLITFLFLLSHGEIRKSLLRSRGSEKTLMQEKEVLVEKIKSQGKELMQEKTERINELAKFAEFGRLSQGLLHDLMTPLSSVVLHTEHLKDLPKKEAVESYKNLENAIDASKRMAAYIQNVRNSMQTEGYEKIFDLVKDLKEVIELLSYRAKIENINISLSAPKKEYYFGDPIKMRQIFSNLICNSIDACGETIIENKKIQISLQNREDKIILEVKDNGSGIKSEDMNKIFSPFFTTKPIDKGTGIGLSTVKSIVENDLKGSIEVSSDFGKGTSFKITFPHGNI